MPIEEPQTIDTSKMSAGQRAAIELTEAARQAVQGRTFAAGLFMGEFRLEGIAPFPLQKPEDAAGDFEVRLDGCDKPPIATASLEPAQSNYGLPHCRRFPWATSAANTTCV